MGCCGAAVYSLPADVEPAAKKVAGAAGLRPWRGMCSASYDAFAIVFADAIRIEVATFLPSF